MQRYDVNNPQSTALKTCLDFASVVAKYMADIYTTNIQSRQVIAAIEAQTVRDERQDRVLYESMQPTLLPIDFLNNNRSYRVEGSGETDSDSDSD
jgi:3-isopropylmalate dehydratase small subunit